MTCPYGHSDGAYVLGALSPAERAEYEAHLAGCEACAAAVARLAPVPGLLGRVDPAALHPDPKPAQARVPRLLAAVTRRRRQRVRRRRWQLAAVAVAAAVVAAGGTAGVAGLVAAGGGEDGTGPDAPVVAMRPVTTPAPLTAEVATWPETGGTGVWMACHYPPVSYQAPASTFRLVAVGTDGTSEQLGSWRAAPGDEVTLTGLTRFTGDELVRLELRNGSDRVLLATS